MVQEMYFTYSSLIKNMPKQEYPLNDAEYLHLGIFRPTIIGPIEIEHPEEYPVTGQINSL